MPTRYRRSRPSYSSRMARVRYLWVTINGSLTPSLTTGQFSCTDLLADYEALAGNVDQVTVKRVRISLTPNQTPAALDSVEWGLAVGRKNDIGANVAGAITTGQIDYPWMFHDYFTMNGTIGNGGSNRINISWKGTRRVTYNQLTLGLYTTSHFVAAAQWRLHSRVLLQLP